MKKDCTALLRLSLIVCTAWLKPADSNAQTLTTLHSFTARSDGANPWTGLVQFSNTLYGTTSQAGSAYDGTVFAINVDGTGFKVLSNLSGAGGGTPFSGTGLTIGEGILYGTTVGVGPAIPSSVFSMNLDGTGFQVLYEFAGSQWASPRCGLCLSDGTLYGTTFDGGSAGAGSIFALTADGSSFTSLHEFSGLSDQTGNGTNSDGAQPVEGPVVSGGVLFGTTRGGGVFGGGTVYALNIDGTGFTTLYHFPGNNGAGALVLSGNTLYGAAGGGNGGGGVVFAINTNGSDFRIVHDFVPTEGVGPVSLVVSGNTLYGTTWWGGPGFGTVFKVNTDGTAFTTLYVFARGGGEAPPPKNADGAQPYGVALVANTLFGTTSTSGPYGYGTIFKLSLPALRLTSLPSGTTLVLSWPADATGFVLQSTTTPANGVSWQDTAVVPAQTNGQNVVSISMDESARYFRLRGP